jgi:hypothetical protein
LNFYDGECKDVPIIGRLRYCQSALQKELMTDDGKPALITMTAFVMMWNQKY